MVLYKSTHLEVKDVDDTKGIVKAYYSAYGNEDSDGDIIAMGAATKSVKEGGPNAKNRIKHLKNHDRNLQPGVIQELGEDANGGWFVSKLMQHRGEFTALAKDTLIEYQAGGITEHSHALDVIKRDNSDRRIIRELKLWEVSSLNAWGANPLTPTVDIKSKTDILETLKKLNNLLKIGEFSDGYLQNIEAQVKELNTVLKSLIVEPRSTLTPEPTFDFNKFHNFLKN